MVAPDWCTIYTRLNYADKGRGPHGYDCWGFVRHVAASRFGFYDLPDLSAEYPSAQDAAAVANVAQRYTGALAAVWPKAPEAREGDIVILRLAGHPWHCGIVVGGGWMMHMLRGVNVVLERYEGPVWRNRIEGFYRHV